MLLCDEALSVGRRSYCLGSVWVEPSTCWQHLSLQVFLLVCSGDFRDLRADEEWSIDELRMIWQAEFIIFNLFHRKLSNETCITLYL